MTISAKVIEHSRHDDLPDLITLQMRYPRFIHAEFMTHRVFSRNASSSRAVPVKRIIDEVLEDPAMPVAWGSNKPGMQAGEEISTLVGGEGVSGYDHFDNTYDGLTPEQAWKHASHVAIQHAEAFNKAGYHKQIVNRLLEPFAHISVVCTSTEWENFFELRRHPDADPTMKALADEMWEAIRLSTSTYVEIGEWGHLPYVTLPERINFGPDVLARVSAARCARVSYLNHDGTSCEISKDLDLAKMLRHSKHMSPFEHIGCPTMGADDRGEWGNFRGWRQYRKLVEMGLSV